MGILREADQLLVHDHEGGVEANPSKVQLLQVPQLHQGDLRLKLVLLIYVPQLQQGDLRLKQVQLLQVPQLHQGDLRLKLVELL